MALTKWKSDKDVATWSPFEDLVNMQRELGHVFDSLFTDFDANGSFVNQWAPHVDVMEHKDAYLIKAELPGVKKDDVKIVVQDSVLKIKGEKNQENEEKDSNYHRIERSYGSFERSFNLPTGVKSDKIDATYKDGVLTVTLPKAEEAKPKEIEVKVS